MGGYFLPMSHHIWLTKEEYLAVKQFNSMRKSDESNSFVIFDHHDYHDNLHCLLRDETKFTKLRKNTTDSLKCK